MEQPKPPTVETGPDPETLAWLKKKDIVADRRLNKGFAVHTRSLALKFPEKLKQYRPISDVLSPCGSALCPESDACPRYGTDPIYSSLSTIRDFWEFMKIEFPQYDPIFDITEMHIRIHELLKVNPRTQKRRFKRMVREMYKLRLEPGRILRPVIPTMWHRRDTGFRTEITWYEEGYCVLW